MFKKNNIEKGNIIKNKKKNIIIAIIAILVIVSIAGATVFLLNNNNEPEVGQDRTIKLYDELISKGTYTFNTFLDENNKMYYSKSQKVAYIDTIYEGEESEYVVKDGNSYLINDEDEIYYTYHNNEIDLRKIEEELENIKDLEYVTGKEKIGNKEYKYEEYNEKTNLMFKDFEDIESKEVKTRFYYDGNKLVYIQTFVDGYKELLKIEISYDVDSKLFEIPSDYKEA